MPNADPNDILRQTPPEVFGHLESLVSELEQDIGLPRDIQQLRERRAVVLRNVLRGLRERDVMAEVIVRYEVGPLGSLEGRGVAQDVRDAISMREDLWELPNAESAGT